MKRVSEREKSVVEKKEGRMERRKVERARECSGSTLVTTTTTKKQGRLRKIAEQQGVDGNLEGEEEDVRSARFPVVDKSGRTAKGGKKKKKNSLTSGRDGQNPRGFRRVV